MHTHRRMKEPLASSLATESRDANFVAAKKICFKCMLSFYKLLEARGRQPIFQRNHFVLLLAMPTMLRNTEKP